MVHGRARVALFIFTRDLRLYGNDALDRLCHEAALKQTRVEAWFALDPVQADPARNAYYSPAAVQFMLESLADLDGELGRRLRVFEGSAVELLDARGRLDDVVAVGVSGDWTPFARRRQAALEAWCASRGAQFVSDDSHMSLVGPHDLGKPYLVFTPFLNAYEKWSAGRPNTPHVAGNKDAMSAPRAIPGSQAVENVAARIKARDASDLPAELALHGGRSHGLRRLHAAARRLASTYEETRDVPGRDGTSQLSPYLKFGCVSLHEVQRAFAKCDAFVRQLVWRAFYEQLAFWHPRLLDGQVNIKKKNGALYAKRDGWAPRSSWSARERAAFEAWVSGRTGVPLVDAGMRQLLATGWMHNRARMVAASYLAKDLGIDWREGERHFARSLVDYDPCANSGNWQWIAGCGADPRQAFRRLSPWRQACRFDPDAAYIKRWVPELAGVPTKHVLAWDMHWRSYVEHAYPPPLRGEAGTSERSARNSSSV
jgi:deoxyribodipyrimidine photo-lyase